MIGPAVQHHPGGAERVHTSLSDLLEYTTETSVFNTRREERREFLLITGCANLSQTLPLTDDSFAE